MEKTINKCYCNNFKDYRVNSIEKDLERMNDFKNIGYKLTLDNEECCLYKYETPYEIFYIRFDKLNCNVSKKCMVFHTKGSREDWITMVESKKENDWILHSTKYGHWANEHTEISLSELDCIIEKCKELGWR